MIVSGGILCSFVNGWGLGSFGRRGASLGEGLRLLLAQMGGVRVGVGGIADGPVVAAGANVAYPSYRQPSLQNTPKQTPTAHKPSP